MTLEIRRLVGVYDADGTVFGELAYFARARLGRAHCSLCDITHGAVRERSAWRRARAGLGVPFDTYHRDDQPPEVRGIGAGAPIVLADTGEQLVLLLDRAALDRCDGSPERLVAALRDVAAARGLRWPTRAAS